MLHLQALLDCHILDTPRERRFDTITRLLTSIFKASLWELPATGTGPVGLAKASQPACENTLVLRIHTHLTAALCLLPALPCAASLV